MSVPLSLGRKVALTSVVTLLIGMLGAAYQFYYLEERSEYEHAIRAHYRKTFGAELDDKKLRHLSTLALDRYGPTEFYRNEEDYHKLFREEAD